MIFGGPVAYDSKRLRKLERREVHNAELATLAFLDRSESTITFDHDDHLDRVPQPG
jgi:hypothetical protein